MVPWWAYSPSPMTLTFYSILSFYGAYKLNPRRKIDWLFNLAEAAFVVGLVIMPFDLAWQLFQWFKYSYLWPDELSMVIGVLIRDGLLFLLCLLSAWKLNLRTQSLHLKNDFLLIVPVLVLLISFLLTSDPVWTDYTYGLRFEANSPWLLSYLTGIVFRPLQASVFIALWKRNFIHG